MQRLEERSLKSGLPEERSLKSGLPEERSLKSGLPEERSLKSGLSWDWMSDTAGTCHHSCEMVTHCFDLLLLK